MMRKKYLFVIGALILLLNFNVVKAQNVNSEIVSEESEIDQVDTVLIKEGSIIEFTYKAQLEEGTIIKGELVSITRLSSNVSNGNAEDYINQLLYLDENFQENGNIKFNDSIFLSKNQYGLIEKILIYFPDNTLKESFNFLYDNMNRVKLCIIRNLIFDTVDAISYTYDNYGRLLIKIFNRKDGDMFQERYAYDDSNNWRVKVLFKEYEPLYYYEREYINAE